MNFYKFVIDKYLKEDSPYGDLAQDMIRDKKINGRMKDETVFNYLEWFPDVEEFYLELKKEYTDTVLKEKAIKKFGYIEDDFRSREELKVLSEELQNPDLKIFSHWSRSLIGNKYDLRHPSFAEYKKHYQKGDVDWLPEGITHVDMNKYIKEKK